MTEEEAVEYLKSQDVFVRVFPELFQVLFKGKEKPETCLYPHVRYIRRDGLLWQVGVFIAPGKRETRVDSLKEACDLAVEQVKREFEESKAEGAQRKI